MGFRKNYASLFGTMTNRFAHFVDGRCDIWCRYIQCMPPFSIFFLVIFLFFWFFFYYYYFFSFLFSSLLFIIEVKVQLFALLVFMPFISLLLFFGRFNSQFVTEMNELDTKAAYSHIMRMRNEGTECEISLVFILLAL